jgi:hypothetical protein
VKPYAVLVPVNLSGPRTGSLTVTVPVSAASEDVARTLASDSWTDHLPPYLAPHANLDHSVPRDRWHVLNSPI